MNLTTIHSLRKYSHLPRFVIFKQKLWCAHAKRKPTNHHWQVASNRCRMQVEKRASYWFHRPASADWFPVRYMQTCMQNPCNAYYIRMCCLVWKLCQWFIRGGGSSSRVVRLLIRRPHSARKNDFIELSGSSCLLEAAQSIHIPYLAWGELEFIN